MKKLIFLLIFAFLLILNFASATLNNGLAAYYSLDDTSTVMFKDSVYGRNGTKVNNPPSGLIGKINLSAGSNSSNQKLHAPANFSLIGSINTGEISLGGWFNLSGTGTDIFPVLFYEQISGPNNQFVLCFEQEGINGRIGMRTANGSDDSRFYLMGSTIVKNRWVFIAVTYSNDGKIRMYVDGLLVNSSDSWHKNAINSQKKDMGILTRRDLNQNTNGLADEIFVYNRTLSQDEIGFLYNDGFGRSYPFTSLFVSLNSPQNNFSSSSTINIFKASLYPQIGENKNATLYIWYQNGTIFNKTTNIVTGTTINHTNWTISNFTQGYYLWNVEGCTESECRFAVQNRTFIIGAEILNTTFNSSSYETALESFILNITIPPFLTIQNAFLNYKGKYPAVLTHAGGNNYLLSQAIDVPLGAGANDWFYTINFVDGFQQNTKINTQIVEQSILGLCNSTLNVRYINYTFKDEITLANINSSIVSSLWSYWLGGGTFKKQLSFLNSSNNPSYAFCFSPQDRILHQDSLIQYASTGYPQRRYFTKADLTNSTTNKVLYLLSSSDGIYSTIQVVNIIGNPIVGATVVIEKQIGGDFVVIGSEETDGAGTVTFWVDPNSNHRITASKIGFISTQQTVRLTQTIYTLIMSSSETNITAYSDLEGITWRFLPKIGATQFNVSTSFNVTISASKSNLLACNFTLMNETTILDSTTSSCFGNSGFLSVTYTPKKSEKLIGVLMIDIGNGFFFVDRDIVWFGYDGSVSRARTLKGILESMSQLNEFGEGTEQEFSRIVFFFFALIIGLGLISFFTGYDFANPGWMIFLLWLILLFASISGWFDFGSSCIGQNCQGGLVKTDSVITQRLPEGAVEALNKYIYITIFSLFTGGYLINYFRKVNA